MRDIGPTSAPPASAHHSLPEVVTFLGLVLGPGSGAPSPSATGLADQNGPANATPYVPPQFDASTDFADMPWRLVGAALQHFCTHLALAALCDDAECVHQARVGWRHLQSAVKLLNSVAPLPAAPDAQPLAPLRAHLRVLRELDVARFELLPLVVPPHPKPGSLLHAECQRVALLLEAMARQHRQALRAVLESPSTTQALWAHVTWLEQLRHPQPAPQPRCAGQTPEAPESLAAWAQNQTQHLHDRLVRSRQRASTASQRHRVRILAKRLRYAIEDFSPLLPASARKWQRAATQAQDQLGRERDQQTTAAWLDRCGAPLLAQRMRRFHHPAG